MNALKVWPFTIRSISWNVTWNASWVLLLFLPPPLLQGKPLPLEESLTRAQVLHHAGAYNQSRLLYESVLHEVDRDLQRDILTYNIGTSLLSEGQPQAALDLWSSTMWAPSPPPWLTRRLSWNAAVAEIQKTARLNSTKPEGQLEQLRLLNSALNFFQVTNQAECIWNEALSSKPCRPTLKLQEATEWTEQRLFALQSSFRAEWIQNSRAIDLVGAILAAMERFETDPTEIHCLEAYTQILPYSEALKQFPSVSTALRSALMDYQTACLPPFDAKKFQAAKEAFTEQISRLNFPLYIKKESRKIRLLYAQGLAEWGNLLHAAEGAKEHRALLKGSQEGQWAANCAHLGEEAFAKGQFATARLLWQLTCFWMDEQAALLNHPPKLDETAQRLLNRHLWTQFFTTHLAFLREAIEQPGLQEALTELVQSTLGNAASLFSLAREAQLSAFESNTCSTVAWDQALPLINQGETSMQEALKILQNNPLTQANLLNLTNTIQHAYPFWVDGVKALHQKASEQQQQIQEAHSTPPPSFSSDQSLSIQQRTLLLQEMEADDRPIAPQNAPPEREVRPW